MNYKMGFIYKVYANGDIYKDKRLIDKIENELVLSYIMSLKTSSTRNKRVFDTLVDYQPESVLQAIKQEESTDKHLRALIAKREVENVEEILPDCRHKYIMSVWHLQDGFYRTDEVICVYCKERVTL